MQTCMRTGVGWGQEGIKNYIFENLIMRSRKVLVRDESDRFLYMCAHRLIFCFLPSDMKRNATLNSLFRLYLCRIVAFRESKLLLFDKQQPRSG